MKNNKKMENNLLEELLDKVNKMQLDIEFLKGELNQQRYYPSIPIVELDKCTDGKDHDYPFPWHSTQPAHCKKCGKQGKSFDITFTDNSASPTDFDKFGGNMMYSESPIVNYYTKGDMNTGNIR